MLRSGNKQTAKARSRGAALTELSIALPVLAVLMVTTFEVGRVFSQYLTLSQIAYEGARAGSQLILESSNSGCFRDYVLDDMEANQNLTNGPDNPHRKIMARVTHLIGLQGENVTLSCDTTRSRNKCRSTTHPEFATRPTISAEYIPAAGLPAGTSCHSGTAKNGTYAIQIRGQYNAMLLPIQFPVTVESRALILTSNQNFSPKLDGEGTEGLDKEGEQ